MLANEVVVLDVRLTRSSADGELIAFDAHVPKLLNAGDRHEVRRLREPEVHQRDEALPSCEHPRVVAELPQQRQGFGAVLRARWYSKLAGFMVFATVNTYGGLCQASQTDAIRSSIRWQTV